VAFRRPPLSHDRCCGRCSACRYDADRLDSALIN
jgi:hypothetical protein